MRLRTALLFFLVSSAFVTTSCAPSIQGDSRAAEEAKLRALDEQWSATAARNDLEGTVAFYASNAVLLPPNAPIATNHNQVCCASPNTVTKKRKRNASSAATIGPAA